MIQILENFPLKNLNTFGVEAQARWFAEVNTPEDLQQLFTSDIWKNHKRFVLGGGSNVLFTQDFDGLIVKVNIRGIEYREEGDAIYVTAGAGEVWNDLVTFCVGRGFAGLENLSLIPGSVGASPVQNIGAYGVEVKDVLYSCSAFSTDTAQIRQFSNADCRFAYRDSVFKSELKNKFIITQVTFKLSKIPHLKLEYGAIRQELANRGISNPTIKDISDVVSQIRVNKLPDPSTIGNAGSFFKNPIIPVDKFRHLQSAFPDIVHFSVDTHHEKISAGWMIEKLGWKGRFIGPAGTWKNQALVLVNSGNATGIAIYELSDAIIADVEKHFDITLEREVNIL
ncbi:UDP-N-acetylmuramate dehydrogenase [Pedobacter sp. BS3]|uniref:UDP-N-acetylmuramate dehydrogenase n=1 Tax=Pedobacter sp. BS3 TaxID=2567937 RepID=UPI0011ED425F|nr:UDP-N-acetylmuramate dehydrogenase [Pedobacter sp. BS3]TZF80814.1 UDP-N-acetylmuramate dehydrogenase [Pedobacter sp. BS3]